MVSRSYEQFHPELEIDLLDVGSYDNEVDPSDIPPDTIISAKIVQSAIYDGAKSLASILEDMQDADINLCAKVEGETDPIGVASAYMEGGRTARLWLQSLAVNETFRSYGIGTALMEELENQAIDMGAEQIALRVTDGERVASFYERLGFEEIPDKGNASAIIDMVKILE